jgi:hypothetical protein
MKKRFLKCAKFAGALCWLLVRETLEMILMSLGVFYLGASFARHGVQPHFLSGHEAWAVFIQLMNVFFTKAGRCGQ